MNLTGGMLFLSVCSLFFPTDGRSSSRRASWGCLGQLPGPLWAVLGRSQGLRGWSWTALRASVGGPGPSWWLCWRSWAVLARKMARALAGRRSGKGSGQKSGPSSPTSEAPRARPPAETFQLISPSQKNCTLYFSAPETLTGSGGNYL